MILRGILIDKQDAGFTLIELLIVIAIALILSAGAVPIYGGLQVTSQLNDSEDKIIQTIRTAQLRAVAGLNDSSHGVYFDISESGVDRYILFQGTSFDTRNTDFDRVETMPGSLSLETSLPERAVLFSQGLGVPSTLGSITVIHDVAGSREISLNSVGLTQSE
jgi:prepilin-type N-terminal cleavage/methylation domain-containing protein